MDEAIFKKLLEVAVGQDKNEMVLVHNGHVAAMGAYGRAPTKQTKENWDSAREAVSDTVARLAAKYFPGEQPGATGERFINRKQALNWLNAQGYKISQGKFYQDCGAGFPMIQRDGTVSRYQVMQYGQQLDVSSRSMPLIDLSGEREELEIRKLRAEVMEKELKARREDHRWLHKEDAWAAVAALLSTLQDNIRHHLHEGQGVLVHLAGGDPVRESEVFEATVELVGRAFDELAGARLEGLFATAINDDASTEGGDDVK
jgi:protein-tyrosine phosphatase